MSAGEKQSYNEEELILDEVKGGVGLAQSGRDLLWSNVSLGPPVCTRKMFISWGSGEVSRNAQ
jgi:hypothetical protein